MSPAEGSRATTRRSRKSIAAIPTSDSTFDKENTKDILAGGDVRKAGGRKLRSKSIGPGGLEALNESAGNAQKAVPRSILKPTIPLSPLRPIPSRAEIRKASPIKSQSGTPATRQSPNKRDSTIQQSGLANVPNPFEDGFKEKAAPVDATQISLKTEEEQQAAAREREKKEIIARRDARRKSLANRRVSFAPEATLHTWDVVELPEDATSSSEATNTTRRASSGSSLPNSPFPQHDDRVNSDTSEPLSTPPTEEIQVAASPAHQRDLHQKKRRRSSGIPPMNFNDPNDFSSSPTSSVGSDDHSFMSAEDDMVIDASDSDSDKDIIERDETVTNVDGDTTMNSVGQPANDDLAAQESSGKLDAALRQATQHAGAQTGVVDADEDVSMDMANDEITYAFKPWINSGVVKPNLARGLSSQQDQENVDPAAAKAQAHMQAGLNEDEGEEMTMEVTQAVGGILGLQSKQSPKQERRKSVAPNRRRSSMGRRRSSMRPAEEGDETMELTTAIGGIQQSSAIDEATSNIDENEEMSMEFTAVLGGVLNRPKTLVPQTDDEVASEKSAGQDRRSSIGSEMGDDGMDTTMPMGGILSPVTERTEPSEGNTAAMDFTVPVGSIVTGEGDKTAAMDFTAAVGSILPQDLKAADKNEARALMEEEVDHGQLTRSPFVRQTSQDMLKATTPKPATASISETGSPTLTAAQTRSNRRSLGNQQKLTPRSASRQTTPLKKPTTPSKQITPQSQRPTTPSKTPPAKNIAMRKNSPKKLFKNEIKKQAKSPKAEGPMLQFNEDTTTGLAVPSVVLTPRNRRPSGLGIDQAGIGSPRAAALLDRRTSIGEQAASFTPRKSPATAVRFADPRVLEQEIDNERKEDERRESGRGILEREVDGPQEEDPDATTSLRDMINSMTPKKNKLKGRKSLAVGAARGLLGKRPAELDDEDEEATPKRLKGGDRSPVKSVHLPAPPSKDETTGRLGKAPRFDIGGANADVTTPVTQTFTPQKATTPKDHGRFKDTEVVRSAAKPPVSFNEQMAGASVETDSQNDDDRIHLQDFLNMTSIRFMELTTTKRRHTIAPSKHIDEDGTTQIGEIPKADDDRRLSACVIAGASTIPMLELYQHSCRELKKYIAEGRSIVREIEADTFEENPPLFREYLTASPSVRSIMDNQFKNIKTHARLLSKGMWYEWRTKLQQGLKEGLLNIGNGLVEDGDLLEKQEQVFQSVIPALLTEHEKLSTEVTTLQKQADALANCDQDELREARNALIEAEADIEAKREQLATLQAELSQQEATIETATERKATCLREIEEAERIREEFRGWTPAEVSALKSQVDALQRETGWTITAAHDNTLTLSYRNVLSLFLTPAAFAPHANANSSNAAISLTYTPKDEKAPSTIQRFFLQYLRARILAVSQAQTPLSQILGLVKNGWSLAESVAEQVSALDAAWPTDTAILSDECLRVHSEILLRDMRTKVDVFFDVSVEGSESDFTAQVVPNAKVVYGEELKEGKMGEFLQKKSSGVEGWLDAMKELEERLKQRGKR